MKRRAIVRQIPVSKGAGARFVVAFPISTPILPRRTSEARIAAKVIAKAKRR